VKRALLLLLISSGRAAARQGPPPAIDPRVDATFQIYDRGDKAAAKRELDKLLVAAASDPAAMVLLAHGLDMRQEYAWAEPFARRAVLLRPDFAPCQYALGVSLLFTDHVEEAERVLRAAAGRFAGTQDEPDLVFSLAMACVLQNKRLEGGLTFAKAIELQPKNALYRFSAAENDRNLKRLAEAEAGFRLAMTLEPPHADAAWKLAMTLAELGRFAEAEPLFQRAIAQGTPASRQSAAYQFAVFLFERGRAQEALPLLQALVKARPADRMAWNYLARTLRALGHKEESAAALKRYQSLQAEFDRTETDYLLGLIRAQRSGGRAPDGKQMPERH